MAVDLPLDPNVDIAGAAQDAGQQIATSGDFVQYTLTLREQQRDRRDHGGTGGRSSSGWRALSRGLIAPQWRPNRGPVLAADGAGFTYTHPSLAIGETITLRYVLRVHRGHARHAGDAINTAQAFAPATCARTRRARWCA